MLSKGKILILAPWALLGVLGCGSASIVKESAAQAGQDDDAGMHMGGGGFGDGGMSMAADPACDMTGLWATRMTTWAHGIADTLGANWYYLEIAQDGEQLTVIDHFDCGIYVDAGFPVRASEKLMEVLIDHNRQTGRKGTMKRSGDRCDLWLDRFWSVRGVDDTKYLPRGHHDPRGVKELSAEAPLPSEANPTGAQDWDMDMHPGISMLIGNNDARYSVQRDWLEWFTCNGNGVNASLCKDTDPELYGLKAATIWDEFTIRVDFDNEDSVLGATNDLFKATGEALRNGVNNRIKFKLLGRTRSSDLAKAFWALPDDMARCARIRDLLPAESQDSAPK